MASFVLMAVILVTNFEAELNPIIPSIEFPNDINIRKGIFPTSLIFLSSTNGRTKENPLRYNKAEWQPNY